MRELNSSATKVAGEYCWAITQAIGRYCWGRSGISVLECVWLTVYIIISDLRRILHNATKEQIGEYLISCVYVCLVVFRDIVDYFHTKKFKFLVGFQNQFYCLLDNHCVMSVFEPF